jgi:hypothetical protein
MRWWWCPLSFDYYSSSSLKQQFSCRHVGHIISSMSSHVNSCKTSLSKGLHTLQPFLQSDLPFLTWPSHFPEQAWTSLCNSKPSVVPSRQPELYSTKIRLKYWFFFSKGWRVCNPFDREVLHELTWLDMLDLEGCYAYNAAMRKGQCKK